MTTRKAYTKTIHENYPNQDELLNKRLELVSKCRYFNKYLLSNCKVIIDIRFNTFQQYRQSHNSII